MIGTCQPAKRRAAGVIAASLIALSLSACSSRDEVLSDKVARAEAAANKAVLAQRAAEKAAAAAAGSRQAQAANEAAPAPAEEGDVEDDNGDADGEAS